MLCVYTLITYKDIMKTHKNQAFVRVIQRCRYFFEEDLNINGKRLYLHAEIFSENLFN